MKKIYFRHLPKVYNNKAAYKAFSRKFKSENANSEKKAKITKICLSEFFDNQCTITKTKVKVRQNIRSRWSALITSRAI